MKCLSCKILFFFYVGDQHCIRFCIVTLNNMCFLYVLFSINLFIHLFYSLVGQILQLHGQKVLHFTFYSFSSVWFRVEILLSFFFLPQIQRATDQNNITEYFEKHMRVDVFHHQDVLCVMSNSCHMVSSYRQCTTYYGKRVTVKTKLI